MSHIQNYNCDGDKCIREDGEVRSYPLGGGANLILCFECWAHENRYRFERGRETGNPAGWPQENWWKAEIYQTDPRPRIGLNRIN